MIKKNSQGFTFLEIMVVLILIGIIGLYAAPHVNMIKQQEVRKLAKEMSIDITTQRLRAIATSGAHYKIELTSTSGLGYNNGYRLTPTDLTASGTSNISLDNSKKIHITMQTSPAGMAISAIQFDHEGYMMDYPVFYGDITELLINIEYDGLESNVKFNGITGHYAIE